jgi:thiamine biosynthesis lipoprotein
LVGRLRDQSFFNHIDLTIQESLGNIRFTSENVRIDLGGIAKGYAADRAAAVLSGHGIDQALINLGGDLVALGGKSESAAWNVGIKDPLDTSRLAEIIPLRNQAVATSGNYEQFFMHNGRLYHHLIDPKSAQPRPKGFNSLSIIADNCRDADALATGLYFLKDREIQITLEDNTDHFTFRRMGV